VYEASWKSCSEREVEERADQEEKRKISTSLIRGLLGKLRCALAWYITGGKGEKQCTVI